MAAVMMFQRYRRRALRRNRIFRDRTHPLEIYNDDTVFKKFRFHCYAIMELTASVEDELAFVVLLTLRFYATGTFQDVIGELIGVRQVTTSRTVTRVTDVLVRHVSEWVKMPTRREADITKRKFFAMQGVPNVIGCIDGTHVRIQGPHEQEHEYVNRKNYHSINVQVMCDADLILTNMIAKWPGSVHNARILRQSPLFEAFEGPQPPHHGIILGDSGYMLRTWLMTSLPRVTTPKQRQYKFAHSSTRTTVERCIGVIKQRWRCLRQGLRIQPPKACKTILVCMMLHNRARQLNIPAPPSDSSDSSSDEGEDAGNSDDDCADHPTKTERARTCAGKTVRDRIIDECF